MASKKELPALIKAMYKKMNSAVKNLDFEKAIELRDKIKEYEKELGK